MPEAKKANRAERRVRGKLFVRLRKSLGHLGAKTASHVVGRLIGALRLTYHREVFNDQREAFYRRTGKRCVFAILHAHQLAAMSMSEANAGTLVSRSRDGDLLVPALKACQLVPIRGSTGNGRKGGATALVEMIRHVRRGYSVVVAVDGPRGPRGKVQPGAATIAVKAGVPVVPVVAIADQRWILSKTWDRLQILKPFCNVRAQFGDPIYPCEAAFKSDREVIEEMSQAIEESLRRMESELDPEEAVLAGNDVRRTPRRGRRRGAWYGMGASHRAEPQADRAISSKAA